MSYPRGARHLTVFTLPLHDLVRVLRGDVRATNIPEGAQLVAVHQDVTRLGFRLVLEHPSFYLVAEGAEAPEQRLDLAPHGAGAHIRIGRFELSLDAEGLADVMLSDVSLDHTTSRHLAGIDALHVGSGGDLGVDRLPTELRCATHTSLTECMLHRTDCRLDEPSVLGVPLRELGITTAPEHTRCIYCGDMGHLASSCTDQRARGGAE